MSDFFVKPGETLEAVFENFPPSLAYPVIGWQMTTPTGTADVARNGGTLTEEPAASGRYVIRYPVPGGHSMSDEPYLLTLDANNGTLIPGVFRTATVTIALIPPDVVPSPPPSNAERYVTVAEVKESASLTGQTYADADLLIALDAASRGLEDVYETLWITPTSDTRYYTRSGSRSVHLGDVMAITEVALDYSYSDVYSDGRVWDWDTGLGSYSTILDPSWYRLLPIQAGPAGNGEPYQTLQLSRASQRLILPSGQDAIRVTGSFGWAVTPSGVKTAVKMIAERLTRRTREAPFGIIAIGSEGAAIRARDIANDPDIRFVMRPVSGTQSLFV